MIRRLLSSGTRILRAAYRAAKREHGPDVWQLRRDGLVAGSGLSVETGCILDPSFPWLITIGSRCTLSTNVVIYAHDAAIKGLTGYSRVERVVIGDDVYIGSGSLILPGVTVGSGSIVGAGSVVTKDVAAGTVVAGTPAVPLGSVADFETRQRNLQQNTTLWPRSVGRGLSPRDQAGVLAALARDGVAYVQ